MSGVIQRPQRAFVLTPKDCSRTTDFRLRLGFTYEVTNVIESIFAPIRHRTDAMKRLRTAEFATAVTFALIQKLSKTWRRLRGYRDLLDLPKALAK